MNTLSPRDHIVVRTPWISVHVQSIFGVLPTPAIQNRDCRGPRSFDSAMHQLADARPRSGWHCYFLERKAKDSLHLRPDLRWAS